MSKMTLALQIGVFAGGAYLPGVDNTKAGIKDTTGHGIIALICFIGHDFHDRSALDLGG